MKQVVIVLFFLLIITETSVFAQSCYTETRSKGIAAMRNRDYDSAIDYFLAAKDCPDSPSDNDLTKKIQECKNAKAEIERKKDEEIRQRREEAARKEREEAARKERERIQREQAEQEAARSGYMKIDRLEFRNEDSDDSVISDYNAPLQVTDVKYVVARIIYKGLCSSSKKITLQVKIFNPDGTLKRGSKSPDNCSFDVIRTIYSGDNICTLSGWGNASGGSFIAGTYRYEIWYEGNKIYSQNFVITGNTKSTTLTVDSKSAVSSTFSKGGGTETFYVNTDASVWKTWGVPDWCSVENKTQTSFTLRCLPNSGSSQRSDYMKIKTENQEVRIDITQKGNKSATIEKVWVDHNVYEGAVKGMRIHVSFSVSGMLSQRGSVTAYFHFSNGEKLKDYNGSYRTSDGQVSCSTKYTPPYETSRYGDVTLFMPYDEMHMSSGKHSLKFDVWIWDDSGSSPNKLASSEYTSFTFTK